MTAAIQDVFLDVSNPEVPQLVWRTEARAVAVRALLAMDVAGAVITSIITYLAVRQGRDALAFGTAAACILCIVTARAIYRTPMSEWRSGALPVIRTPGLMDMLREVDIAALGERQRMELIADAQSLGHVGRDQRAALAMKWNPPSGLAVQL